MSRQLNKLLVEAAYMSYKHDKQVARRQLASRLEMPPTSDGKRRIISKGVAQTRRTTKQVAKSVKQVQPQVPLPAPTVLTKNEQKEDEIVDIHASDDEETFMKNPPTAKLRRLAELISAARYMEYKMDARDSHQSGEDMLPSRIGKRPAPHSIDEEDIRATKKAKQFENPSSLIL
jgi:hypothetical protein